MSAYKFGDYVYADVVGLEVEEDEDPLEVRMRTGDTPGRDGSYSAGGLRGPHHFTISCFLKGTSYADLRSKWRAFRTAHAPGTIRKFFRDSDAFYWAEVEGIGQAKLDGAAQSWRRFTVDFYCADPLEYTYPQTTVTGLAGGGTVTTLGTAPTRPVITLVVGTGGAGKTITVTNSTTGDSFILSPGAAQTYVIDCGAETILVGTTDKSGELAPGGSDLNPYLRLAAGANTITVVEGGGADVTSMQFAYYEAFE